ncbi:rhomboid-like protein [Georgenia sp. SYP-B2076]|uniref:rhomboid-like protein n=1 Tax=Georgenia sp. SYP-B2076 TaxID=2495881 RepID=UPI000F8D1333|nr:rhomboid-like protein [Georgenia sp. SYP-B2076]
MRTFPSLRALASRTRLRRVGRTLPGLLRGSDVAITYASVVTVVAVVLALAPAHVRDDVVQRCSTNLTNLRDRPVFVLVVSAFVIPSLQGLWQLPLLVLLYTAAQRWVGRAATVFVAALGHVGATLLVAALIASGITHGRLAASVARASDVGVSYGLACLAGFLVSRAPARWRAPYVVAAAAYFVAPLLINQTFTDVGHATAFLLGLGLAFLAARVAAAADVGGRIRMA